MYEIVVEKTIACAHFLRDYPGPCARLHGHNYTVRAILRGRQLNAAGMLVDFSHVKDALWSILARFDHRTLNDLPEFAHTNPSTEYFARVIAEELRTYDFGVASLFAVQVQETANQSATYYVDTAEGP